MRSDRVQSPGQGEGRGKILLIFQNFDSCS